jgi:subtilisin family serine protease
LGARRRAHKLGDAGFDFDGIMPPLQSAAMDSSPSISLTHVMTDISDHGLFVAGLIHAVAPDSELQLYPVLDQYGCGNLYTLITRLHTFISQAEVDRQNGRLNGAVINLSLGVLKPKNTDVIGMPTVPVELQQTQTSAGSVAQQLDEAYDLLKIDDIKSLAMTMQVAYQQGIVVVAAAGNDSWRDEYQSQPRPPQYPAAYPFVIGVAGSNANRQRSCFSNWGDVSAPAGDGAPGEVTIVSARSRQPCSLARPA